MIKEIFPNIFQIRVPLPHSPLKHLNSYLIKSDGKNLLIDTGLNFPQAFQSLCNGLTEAGLKPENLTDVLLTHFHVDHVGLIPRFKEASKNLRFLIHPVEAEFSRRMFNDFESYMRGMENFLKANGAPSFIALNLQRFHPAFFTPQAYQELAFTEHTLEDSQKIAVGGYNFHVLWTPGHSPGHVCLYEASLKVLISGDHLLPTISPHIAQFIDNMDPLTDYLNSLEKIEKLEVKVVLPAHEEIFTNCYERIKQLKEHHENRLVEILNKLEVGSSTAFTLASKVHWNVGYKSWEEFPPFQKYLALGETVAHLNVLERKCLVKKTKVNETIFYSKSS
jgi:glyoxylase-like metal-dependent hydrolase (beta-lactamase superfamily II)